MQDLLLQTVLEKLPETLHTLNIEPITIGQSGSRVYRLRPKNAQAVVLKITEPQVMPEYLTAGYPHIADTEYNFYTQLAPRLGLPCPKLIEYGRLAGKASFLVLEDVTLNSYIPPEGHMWSTAEMISIVTTYAQMHGRAQRLFSQHGVPTWLNPDPRLIYSAEKTEGYLRALAQNSWTKDTASPIVLSAGLKQLLLELQNSLRNLPPTLLYNDFYPPNVALSKAGGSAVLFDYQLISSGPHHIDISNIGFLRSDKTFCQVDGEAVLAHYLHILSRQAGEVTSPLMFLSDYRHANLLAWADYLPRFVRAMHRSNAKNEHWGQWMDDMFAKCMQVWARELS
ncbi:MAG: hypothetical protein FD169_1122 [Bacillota bacterium]|nr:MAG: hypothetical protein FD169_1122 [Bacillota bacterium]